MKTDMCTFITYHQLLMLLCSFPVQATQIVCNWTRWNWRLAGKLAQSTAPSFLGVNICMFGICICYWTCIYICIYVYMAVFSRVLNRDLTLFSPLVVMSSRWKVSTLHLKSLSDRGEKLVLSLILNRLQYILSDKFQSSETWSRRQREVQYRN